MDDEPMWVADRVVAPTPGSAITILKTTNEFAIKGNAQKLPWSQFIQRQYHQNLLSRPQRNDSRSSKCRSWWKAFSCNALANLGAIINLMPYSLYAKLSLETLKPTKISVRLADRSFQHPIGIAENMLVKVGKFTFPVDFIILEMEKDKEDFVALLDEGSKILHSIEGTILEEKLFAEFDEFMSMTANENSKYESDTEEPLLEKITFNTDYKIRTSLEEPPSDLELKPLPDNLEYVFLEEPDLFSSCNHIIPLF
ncbi:reverse transcriptase domain-containing protein [Tanacetum coccineum]